ncbi:MAG: CehA/McbA family metallohydrolase [Clostridiales bacterium]|nr:CehA/McbA family metallohydrolase [Clostridiales bacterium]
MKNMLTHSFTRLVEKAEERQYLRIPFEVMEDIETITIAYDYTRHRISPKEEGMTRREEINIIDLALEDPQQSLVGASGSERKEIKIHENYATPGYHGVPIQSGTWYLVLGAYLIEQEGCPVSIKVTQKRKETVLLRGDTHTHTVHSDGWYTVDEAIARARQDRLDYLFITDHNSMTSNAYLRSYPDLTVLPGVEVTYYDGHYNMFGLKRPVKTYVANSRDEVLAIMREGKEKGALVSLNHPCDKSCGWTYGIGSDVPCDMVEIWNGPFIPYNQASVDLWHEQLCKGRIWPAIGGSDCHRAELFRNVAAPATFLYSNSRAGSDILDAMKSGHAFIGMNTSAPVIYIAMGDARMGDIYQGAPMPLELRVDGLAQGDEIRLIDQTGIIWRNKPGACWRYETSIEVKDSIFLRVEIWRELFIGMTTLASISNPIYIR